MSTVSLNEFEQSLRNFGWTDYAVFALMLLACMVIGVYFSWRIRMKGNGALDYLVGGRKLTLLPVSVSLVVSVLSGIGLLGTSTEIYMYGSQYVPTLFALILVGLSLHIFVLPVLHKLKFISLYEYLELRFNRYLRLYGSLMFLLSMRLLSTKVRTSERVSRKFNSIYFFTGVDVAITTPVVCCVCIFYTCLGGLKAVIWTDVIQAAIMLGSLIVVAIHSTIVVGGFGVVWERNLNSTRIEPVNFAFDPTIRSTFWSVVVGGWFYHLSLSGIDQSLMQRYLSLPTLRQARQAVWFFVLGFWLIVGFAIFNGFLLYAMYYDCDPLTSGLVKRKDQLIPLLVMDTMRSYPIVKGFFITGVFSASLSTVSTALNSMSAVILEDFFKLVYGDRLTERSIGFILRATVIILGLVTMSLVFIVEKLGPVLELTISLAGVTNGPLAGVFVIGLTMPWIGSRPTMIGAVSGVCVASWVIFKAQADLLAKVLTHATKPLTTDGCHYSFNSTVPVSQVDSEREFYHFSYLYYCFVGGVVTIVVAVVLSLTIDKQDSSIVGLNLITPPLRKFYKRSPKIPMENLNSFNSHNRYYAPRAAHSTAT